MKYDGSNLEEVLEESRKFDFTAAHQGSKAVFSSITVNDFEVPGAVLYDADFLSFGCLDGEFSGAKLNGASFISSWFNGVGFRQASMRSCRFFDSVFVGCDFEGVDASHSSFYNCIFESCNFQGAMFVNVFFDDSSFKDITNAPFIPMACPDAGGFIGWKRAIVPISWCSDVEAPIGRKREIGFDDEMKEVIVKLLIPDDAKRSSGLGRKCRCDKAIVLEIQDLNGTRLPNTTIAISFYDNSFGYIAGRTVTPEEPFDENRFNECASGIHFFVNREEAARYHF